MSFAHTQSQKCARERGHPGRSRWKHAGRDACAPRVIFVVEITEKRLPYSSLSPFLVFPFSPLLLSLLPPPSSLLPLRAAVSPWLYPFTMPLKEAPGNGQVFKSLDCHINMLLPASQAEAQMSGEKRIHAQISQLLNTLAIVLHG